MNEVVIEMCIRCLERPATIRELWCKKCHAKLVEKGVIKK